MAHTANTNCSDRKMHANRASLLEMFRQMRATSRQRRILRNLDSTALKDIGISSAQAHVEAKRPIWDVPGYWLK